MLHVRLLGFPGFGAPGLEAEPGIRQNRFYRGYGDCIGIMEKKFETTIEYWGNTGIMEKKMETSKRTAIYKGFRCLCKQLRPTC